MVDAIEDKLDAALLVRRRFQAELIVSEATADTATSLQVARLKLKLRHLDGMIARFEQELGQTGWWNVRAVVGNSEQRMTA